MIKYNFSDSTASGNAQEVYNFCNAYCLDIFDNVELMSNTVKLTKGTAYINIKPADSTVNGLFEFHLSNGVTGVAGYSNKVITKVVKTKNGIVFYTSDNSAHFINKSNDTIIVFNPKDTNTIANLNNSSNFTTMQNMTKIICNMTAFTPVVVPDSAIPTNGLYYMPFLQYDLAFGTISTGNLNFACSGYVALKD